MSGDGICAGEMSGHTLQERALTTVECDRQLCGMHVQLFLTLAAVVSATETLAEIKSCA